MRRALIVIFIISFGSIITVNAFSSHTKIDNFIHTISFNCQPNTTYYLNQSDIHFKTCYGKIDHIYTYENNYIITEIIIDNFSLDIQYFIYLISANDIITIHYVIHTPPSIPFPSDNPLIDEISEEIVYFTLLIIFIVCVFVYGKK